MNLKHKRIFISGGAGVIGRELVKKLVDSGAHVFAGDLDPIPHDFPKNILFRRGDLNHLTQEEINRFNPEIFFHLAASFERTTETYEHWEENFWHNIRLSNHLMSLMRNVPALKRVVYASSYLIYDKSLYNFKNPPEKPVRLKETDPINPRNLTGLAKLAHEIELEFLSHFKADTFTSICARIYRGYGKNSRDVISRWVRDLLNDKAISIYQPEGWFDYMYAGDTAEGLIRLSAIDDSGIVNLGTGTSRKVKDVVNILKRHFPNMVVDDITLDMPYEASEADTDKLKNLLRWEPATSLEEAIPKIIAYEKERRHVPRIRDNGNVLITSVAKKIPLISALKTATSKVHTNIKMIGGDCNANCIGKYFTDDLWAMPRLSELSVDELIGYCEQAQITLIIPTRDGELAFFAQAKEALAKKGIVVMVSSPEATQLCLDKFLFSKEGKQKGLPIIPAFLDINGCHAESFVVKERFGAGAVSVGLNLTKSKAIEHAKTLRTPIFQPFMTGKEISIDAYITNRRKLKGLVMRRRDYVVHGESQITSTFHDEILSLKFKDIIKKLDLAGHIILQAIIDNNQEIHLIECNARFGGASTTSIRAGLDSFYWAYLEAIGEDIDNYPFIRSEKEITQVRYPQDFYI